MIWFQKFSRTCEICNRRHPKYSANVCVILTLVNDSADSANAINKTFLNQCDCDKVMYNFIYTSVSHDVNFPIEFLNFLELSGSNCSRESFSDEIWTLDDCGTRLRVVQLCPNITEADISCSSSRIPAIL